MNRRQAEKSRGAALLLALFVVGMVAALSTRMTGDYLTNIRYQRNYLYGEQAYFYLLSAEALAMHSLLEDLLEDRSNTRWHDSGCESWGADRINLPIPGGSLSVRIRDHQDGLNLNSVGGNQPDAFTIYQRRFIRLLQVVSPDLSEEDAIRITRQVADWIDMDSEPRANGGLEDNDYASLGLPWRTANSPADSVTELRFIPGIDLRLYRRLAPHLRAWQPGSSNVNINTASPAILQALPDIGLRPIGLSDVEYAISERDGGEDLSPADREALEFSGGCGYRNVGEFANLVPWSGNVNQPGLTTYSSDFLIRSEVRLADITVRMQSIARRHRNGRVYVVVRSLHDL